MVDRAKLANVFSKGIAEADAEMWKANPVLEYLIEGLEFIKAQRGVSGSFDYAVGEKDRDGDIGLKTTIPMYNVGAREGKTDVPVYVYVNVNGTIKYCPQGEIQRYRNNSSQVFYVDVEHPQEDDILRVLEDIVKLARAARQIVPAPPPLENALDSVKEMRAQINQNAARNKAGQRSPGQ